MTVLATDTFTDTNGTLLPAHTADTGQSWTKSADSDALGNLTIVTGGKVYNPNAGAYGRAVLNCAPPQADYAISVDMINTGATDDYYPTIWVRSLQANDTGYQCIWQVTTSTITLKREVAGVSTTLNSGALSSATASANVKLEALGAVLNVYVNSSLLFTYTDGSPIVAAGLPAISSFNGATGAFTQSMDNLSVTYTAVAGGSHGGMIHHLRTLGAY